MSVGVSMHDKAIRSAVDAAGAVAALQLVYFVVTSAPGCDVVAGSRTACESNMIQVVGIGVPIGRGPDQWMGEGDHGAEDE